MTNDELTPEVKGRIEAKIEALEWALTLRHEFEMVSAAVATKRGMPAQIRTRIQQEINRMKSVVGQPIDRFPTVRRHKCGDCGHFLWFDRVTDLICTRCGKMDKAA